MIYKISVYLAFVTSALYLRVAEAQTSTNAAGGSATGGGGSVEYSIGQVVYTTQTGSNGSVAQGVQHTYQIITVNEKEATTSISLSVFPNPTQNFLALEMSDLTGNELHYQLVDLAGKVLNVANINAKQTNIDMSTLPSATYFLHVANQENQKMKTFKIIKTN